MTKPLSMDIRDRAMARLDAGETVHEAAAALSVAPSSVVKWSQRRRATGSAAPGKIGGHVPRKIRGEQADWLRARMAEGAFTLRGLVAELAERGLRVDYRTMWAFAHAEGLSFKKTALASEQDRPDIARKRARWKARQGSIDPKRLVFIDETWAKTNMAPLRGWAARGQRLIGRAPFGHWNTMTFVAALRHDGIVAPWVIDGAINGEVFRTYVEQVLVPELRPGDIVILDNLGSHKAPAIRKAIKAAGARLFFLPAYSPDLNPIEQVFAKLKHLLRKTAERSREAVWRRIGTLLDQFSPQECENYLRNSGYGST
ncbi:MAG: IS630 family transposase [Burkholderiaceae bacterium]|nr:IS630 family transposase [Burkholderiaceae bacterium]